MIQSISSFIEYIKMVGMAEKHTNFFRGHSNENFDLIPGIYRNIHFLANENKIFREMIIKIPQEFSSYKNTIEKLVKMQHYGVPTRLLDVTNNPLIALYFACEKNLDEDGQVVFLQIPEESVKFYDSDTVSLIANMSQRPNEFSFEYTSKTSIKEFNKSPDIDYLVDEIKEEKPYFRNLVNPTDLERVLAVKVKLDNPRILKQSGAFLLFGVHKSKLQPAKVPHDWIMNKKLPDFSLVIPSRFKINILQELDLLGINQSTLFPELEYQAMYLKQVFLKSHYCYGILQ